MTRIDPKSLRDNMIKAGLSDGHFKMMGLEPPEEVWEDMQTTSIDWRSEPVIYFKFKPEHPMHLVTGGRTMRYGDDPNSRVCYDDDTREPVVSKEVCRDLLTENLLIRVTRRR